MKTIIHLFEESVRKFGANAFLLQKESGTETNANKAYKPKTYFETKAETYQFAAGLMKLGLNPGDRVALLSGGRNEWVISELGILYNGAINVPLSIKLGEAEEIKFRIEHSGSRMLIISNDQVKKLEHILDKITGLETVILINASEKKHKNEIFYSEVIAMGNEYLKTHREAFEKRYSSVQEDDYANICYTSGTTADPKGIILSHKNYIVNVEQSSGLFEVPEWYTTLLILPWDHSFAHTCGIYTLMKNGASLASIQTGSTPMETLKNIPVNIKEIRPAFLLSVPALAKNFKKNIEKGTVEKGAIAEKLFKNALKLAIWYNGLGWDRGKGLKKLLWPLYKLYDVILFKKIRAGFGGRLKFFVGGGALLDIDLQKFFYAIGIPMYQGYGLSESAPVISSNSPSIHKMGSSGRIVQSLELKICDDEGNEVPRGEKGEIVVQGENIMHGYWKNEQTTKEVLKNGWLYTGDLGYLDKDDFLYVLGRTKSLLISDDGEKFSPEGIEEALIQHSSIIEQCLLYNNQKPYTIALLYPNTETLKKWTKEHNIDLNSDSGLEEVLKKIENEVNEYRNGGKYEFMFPQRWLPSAIAILSEGFTEQNRLINSTLKMVRPRITSHYSKHIEFLYTPEAKDITNEQNMKALKALF